MLCDAEVLSNSKRVQELMIELGELEESIKENYEEWDKLALKL
jgi:hypothetical protein